MLEARWSGNSLIVSAPCSCLALVRVEKGDGTAVEHLLNFAKGGRQALAMPRPRNVVLTSLPFAKAELPRHLRPFDSDMAHVPFPYDPNAFAHIRPDQVPRFLGAVTDPTRLPKMRLPHSSLVAMQNRVDPCKVEAIRSRPTDKNGVVVRMRDRNYIADGHHRLAADWMNGEDDSEVHFLDLTAESNAMKANFAKEEPETIRVRRRQRGRHDITDIEIDELEPEEK